MRNQKLLLLAPAALLLAACGRADPKALDSGLQNDLTLAAQTQQAQPTVSPEEAGYANAPASSGYAAPRRYQAVERAPAPSPVYRTARRYPSSTASSGAARGSSSGTYYPAPAPAPAPEPVRHEKRDAGIGAGAVLGASTSRDKVKGAIIGAAAGGILGGIIGHTVDVDKRP
jgi:hypothetical protein